MAGVTGQRLRLTTTRKPKYRRGGLVIGTAAAPTFVQPGEIEPEQGLAILRDPNITVAIEDEDGEVRTLTTEERAELEEGLRFALDLGEPEPAPASQPDTAEPQSAGNEPAVKASEATGSQDAATATDSTASAGDAVTTEPTAQPSPAAPEPEAPPPPAPKQRAKAKAKTA